MPGFAVVRAVPTSFARALTVRPPPRPLDPARARAQHADYVAALRGLGLDVMTLEADEGLPDCCFVEDIAVVAGGVALITRPGAKSRRGEVAAVRDALAARLPVAEMAAPATLDGGDCLRLGDDLYVGRSTRTNAAGVARAREVFGPRGVRVHEVEVRGGLHLKSLCSPLSLPAEHLVLAVPGAFAPGTFGSASIVEVPAAEAPAANVVCVGSAAIVAAGFPGTTRLLRERGIDTRPIDNSELRLADSALTCLSVIVEAREAPAHSEGVGRRAGAR